MKKIFLIDGMGCDHCISSVRKSLSNLNLEKIDVKIGSAEIIFDEEKTDEKEIINAIEQAGYKVQQKK